MATEIYQPPQELPVTTVVYGALTDTTGSVVYEDPNDVVFVGDLRLAGNRPTITRFIDPGVGAMSLTGNAPTVA